VLALARPAAAAAQAGAAATSGAAAAAGADAAAGAAAPAGAAAAAAGVLFRLSKWGRVEAARRAPLGFVTAQGFVPPRSAGAAGRVAAVSVWAGGDGLAREGGRVRAWWRGRAGGGVGSGGGARATGGSWRKARAGAHVAPTRISPGVWRLTPPVPPLPLRRHGPPGLVAAAVRDPLKRGRLHAGRERGRRNRPLSGVRHEAALPGGGIRPAAWREPAAAWREAARGRGGRPGPGWESVACLSAVGLCAPVGLDP
jgi:hypothetical protein